FGASARPVTLDPSHPVQQAAVRALKGGFGVDPVFVRSGGTIPVVDVLRSELGMPTVLMGFGLRSDHMHAPNEKFLLPHLFRGIESAIRLLDEAAGVKPEM